MHVWIELHQRAEESALFWLMLMLDEYTKTTWLCIRFFHKYLYVFIQFCYAAIVYILRNEFYIWIFWGSSWFLQIFLQISSAYLSNEFYVRFSIGHGIKKKHRIQFLIIASISGNCGCCERINFIIMMMLVFLSLSFHFCRVGLLPLTWCILLISSCNKQWCIMYAVLLDDKDK